MDLASNELQKGVAMSSNSKTMEFTAEVSNNKTEQSANGHDNHQYSVSEQLGGRSTAAHC